ncbi:MAG: hypothetical protein AVDCRST_MAG29-349, partial [uncultured Nocardioidaceae bacterium]
APELQGDHCSPALRAPRRPHLPGGDALPRPRGRPRGVPRRPGSRPFPRRLLGWRVPTRDQPGAGEGRKGADRPAARGAAYRRGL